MAGGKAKKKQTSSKPGGTSAQSGTAAAAIAGDSSAAGESRSRKRAGKAGWTPRGCWGDDLGNELAALGLRIKQITADGNCFFRALGDQLKGDEGLHVDLRQRIVDHIRTRQTEFAPFVEDDEAFDTYVSRMRKDGVWAGNIELVAASQTLGVNITIYQAGQPRWTVRGSDAATAAMLHLSYHDGQHYNSVRNADDAGVGPPQPVAITGNGAVPRRREAATPGQWGPKEAARVAASTACSDAGMVEAALDAAGGDVEAAIERVIERLAATAVLDEQEEEGGSGRAEEKAAAGQTQVDQQAAEIDGVQPELNAQCQNEAVAQAARPGEPCSMHASEASDAAKVNDSGSAPSTGVKGARAAGVRGQRVVRVGRGGAATAKPPARNKDCPCGSKKKYKNCCALRKVSDDQGSHMPGPVHGVDAEGPKAAQLGSIAI